MSYEYDVDVLTVTGQRPKSLGLGSFDPKHPVWVDAYEFALREIHRYEPTRLISGGALGFDMIAAKAAVDAGIELEVAMPFDGYARWGAKDIKRLNWLLDRAAQSVFVCEPGYAPWKYQVRNEYMVDKADYLIALWNGAPGGTNNCLKYAKKARVGYHVHDPFGLETMVPA